MEFFHDTSFFKEQQRYTVIGKYFQRGETPEALSQGDPIKLEPLLKQVNSTSQNKSSSILFADTTHQLLLADKWHPYAFMQKR